MKRNAGDILLANISPLRPCLAALNALTKTDFVHSHTLAVFAEETIGLNLLLAVAPEELMFFHAYPENLAYMKLLIDLIGISESPEEWISRIFSRSVTDFLHAGECLYPFSLFQYKENIFGAPRESISRSLNEFTQWKYLDRPHEEKLLQDTLGRLSPKSREAYRRFVVPHLPGHVLFDHVRCRRLLPCWPLSEPIPYSETAVFGQNLYKELEPNTNTFHYGGLWLANADAFCFVKQRLAGLSVRYLPYDIEQQPLSELLEPGKLSCLFAGKHKIREEKEERVFVFNVEC